MDLSPEHKVTLTFKKYSDNTEFCDAVYTLWCLLFDLPLLQGIPVPGFCFITAIPSQSAEITRLKTEISSAKLPAEADKVRSYSTV